MKTFLWKVLSCRHIRQNFYMVDTYLMYEHDPVYKELIPVFSRIQWTLRLRGIARYYGRPGYRQIIDAIFASRTMRVVSFLKVDPFLLGNRVLDSINVHDNDDGDEKRWWREMPVEEDRLREANESLGLPTLPFPQILSFEANIIINII